MNTSSAVNDIRVSGSFRFGSEIIFKDIDFTLTTNQWTCLIGLSGVGKSTLLRLIAGLDHDGEFEGNISSDDQTFGAKRVAYMAQSDLLLPWLTVTENIALGHHLRRQPLDQQKLSQLIHQVGLEQHSHKKPLELSGGMRQRTALARTLMEDTPIVLLDEPFSALDARTRHQMQNLAYDLLADKTVLLVTHDPAEAVRLGHRLFEISEQTLHQHQLPEVAPIRPVDHPLVLKRQAELLLTLRGANI